MKKLLIALSILAVVVVLLAAGVFGYSKYKEVEMKQQNLETQLENKNEESSNTSVSSDDQATESTEETQTKEDNSTETSQEENKDEQKVTRDNVFDYALAAINENGDADLMKFQEPSYSDGVWTIDANNKSGVGSNMIKVYDDGWVQIYNGVGDVIQETQIEL
ncbi:MULTISPECIES: hypothetical protein [Staphylococcus]|uniref:hypothetical protein n=1 Tax=Staphylococcus TaxID=1279 RepID=UPI0018A6CB7D|nr:MULTISPECIES: hypothetical protein [Staphylococcus]